MSFMLGDTRIPEAKSNVCTGSTVVRVATGGGKVSAPGATRKEAAAQEGSLCQEQQEIV